MTAYNSYRRQTVITFGGLRMGEKTIVKKAAEKVGYGLARGGAVMGAVKTAVAR